MSHYKAHIELIKEELKATDIKIEWAKLKKEELETELQEYLLKVRKEKLEQRKIALQTQLAAAERAIENATCSLDIPDSD